MRTFFLIGCILILSLQYVDAQQKEKNDSLSILYHKADSILSKMTLEEKAGQLSNYGSGKENLDSLIKKGLVGAVGGMIPWKDNVSEYLTGLQKSALNSSLGIPLLFTGDVIHGYRTTFPINIATACSWDTALIRKMDSVAAFEATAAGMNCSFAPMVDISRDPRWGRVVEGAGEDPFLASAIATAEVKGLQGNDLSSPRTMAATAKHFAGYGAVEAGRDYNTVDMSWRRFHELYLPPFQAAIDAGLAVIMPAFISLNGIPASENKHLLRDILRKECGFQGLIISDYDAIPEMLNHRVAQNTRVAAKEAIQAGMDMDLHSGVYFQELPDLVKKGKVSEAVLDSAVKRVLVLKYKLGLFDHPLKYGNQSETYQKELLKRHRPLARKMANESIVLLKNDTLSREKKAILPLSNNIKRLAVIGPLAKDQKTILGPVHALGKEKESISIWQGIQEAVSPQTQLLYAKGTDIKDTSLKGFKEAIAKAKKADAVIMVMGESAGMSGEGDSRSKLGLPGNQLPLVKAIEETGKPIILLLVNGRPLTIPWLDQHIPGIVETWELGTEAGHAVADVIFGDYNPSGKLVMTFPRNTGQIPIYYNHLNTGRPKIKGNKYTSRYTDVPNTPLYPFGYGLSYTHFSYSVPVVNTDSLRWNDSLQITVKVTNEGKMKGTEVVQFYVSDMVASISPVLKKLKGFKRVTLNPGEKKTLTFSLERKDLAFYGKNMEFAAEPGGFEVYVGGSSDTKNKTGFWLLDKADKE